MQEKWEKGLFYIVSCKDVKFIKFSELNWKLESSLFFFIRVFGTILKCGDNAILTVLCNVSI